MITLDQVYILVGLMFLAFAVLTLRDADGEGVFFWRLQHDLRADEVVPRAEKRDEQKRAGHRLDHREGDREEEPSFAAAVDSSGFEQFGRQAGDHRLSEQKHAERRRDGGPDHPGHRRDVDDAALAPRAAEQPTQPLAAFAVLRGQGDTHHCVRVIPV